MRPSWSEYFLEMAALVAKRSTCLRRQVGAVAVKDGRIIATGYNGAPVDFKHCQETGCLRCDKAAHPQMRQIMLPMLKAFAGRIPLLFDDLVEKYRQDDKQ